MNRRSSRSHPPSIAKVVTMPQARNERICFSSLFILCQKGFPPPSSLPWCSTTTANDEKRRSRTSMGVAVNYKKLDALLLIIISVYLSSVLAVVAGAYEDESEREDRSMGTTKNMQRGGDGVLAESGLYFESGREKRSPKEMKEQEKRERNKKKDHRKEGEKGDKKDSAEDEGADEDGEPAVRCAQNLRDAVNGAISLISGTRLLVEHLLRLWNTVPYVPMLVCPSSLFPYNPTLPWPKRENLKKGDLLRDVLDNGVLTVAGVGGASLSDGQLQLTVAKDRGDEGNYNKAEPTGFFPDYLRAIADTIEKRYNAPIRVRWLFYPSVERAQAGVLRGEAHMTDIYFLLAQSTAQEPQPLSHFYSTCPVVGSPLLLIVRDRQPYTEAVVYDLLSLNRAINRGKNDSERRVMFVVPELASTVRHCLSPAALIGFADSIHQASQMVLEGAALAAVTTGVLPRLHSMLKVVSAHVLLGKGAWIERTYAVECVEEEHGLDLAAYAKERSHNESKRLYGASLEADANDAAANLSHVATIYAPLIVLLAALIAL